MKIRMYNVWVNSTKEYSYAHITCNRSPITIRSPNFDSVENCLKYLDMTFNTANRKKHIIAKIRYTQAAYHELTKSEDK